MPAKKKATTRATSSTASKGKKVATKRATRKRASGRRTTRRKTGGQPTALYAMLLITLVGLGVCAYLLYEEKQKSKTSSVEDKVKELMEENADSEIFKPDALQDPTQKKSP